MNQKDCLRRFVFEDLGIRGEIVSLDQAWLAVAQRHPYPEAVQTQLGQALAASMLLSATIKFEGSLIMQAQGPGPLQAVVAQATHERTLRGLARWTGEVPYGSNAEVFGDGHLAITVQTEGQEPYQGVTALEGNNLAAALDLYFRQSEQLATRLWLAADGNRAVGVLVQQLPSQPGAEEDWNRIQILADTLTPEELLGLNQEELLYRIFHQEQVRLFGPEAVSFRCGCSRGRIGQVLIALGEAELEDILNECGAIDVDCEFCNAHYRFDAIDIEALTRDPDAAPASSTYH
jgi:molecular chaperone Hsp33